MNYLQVLKKIVSITLMFNTIGYKQKKKKSKMKTDSQNLTYRTESEIYGYKESRSVLRLSLFLKNPLST